MPSLGEIIRNSQIWKSIFRHPAPLDRRNRVVVMLTNRVHQVAKRSRFELRPQVHDLILEAFEAG